MSLREHKTVALFGKWGSGKRTLAKQVAIKLAREDGLKIEIIRDWLILPKGLESSRTTVLILDNPIKAQHTGSHNANIFDCLLKIRAEKNNCFQIVVFQCLESDRTEKIFNDAKRDIRDLCPKRFFISFSKEIAKKEEKKISLNVLEKLSQNDQSLSMDSTLILTLFLRFPSDKRNIFLDGPVTFILKELEHIIKSQDVDKRLQILTLIEMAFHNGEMTKTKFEAIMAYNIKNGTDKEELTRECIKQLLQIYVEETRDGKSYRLIHDVITRCVLYTALKFINNRDPLYKKCNPLLLLDCVRSKTRSEQIRSKGEFIFDNKTFDIGLPTETFPLLAESLVQRNEIWNSLGNVRIMEDKAFEHEWHMTNGRHNKPKE